MFREYMSSKYQNIKVTAEQENIGSLSFLEVKMCRKNDKFVTSVYKILLRYYFQDLFTGISVVAAMLPIMERPNTILKFEFVSI